jgi:uncharacterized LabA/DUF88 family protein
MKKRVECFIDGFNLYHAIANYSREHDSEKNHLKWVNLWKLMECFASPTEHEIKNVFYFSAYAKWLTAPVARHKKYVHALESVGVKFIKGKFKDKNIRCKLCKRSFIGHEEKQTDVNLALQIFNRGISKEYDIAYIVSCDSDLTPSLKMLKAARPDVQIKLIAPIGMCNSRELMNVAGAKPKNKVILEEHILESLLPGKLCANDGAEIVRPLDYTPPRQKESPEANG